MNPAELKEFSQKAAAQLYGHIFPFWRGPALDREQGGWMAWLSNDLKPDRAQPKGLIVNSRILWTFSAFGLSSKQPQYDRLRLLSGGEDFLQVGLGGFQVVLLGFAGGAIFGERSSDLRGRHVVINRLLQR